jgi:hypothetical protein
LDVDAYFNALKQALLHVPPIFDASQKKVVPWIDVKKLKKKVFKTGSSCLIS